MEPKIEQMKRQLIFMQGVIAEYEKLKTFCEETRQDQWFVKATDAFYFLPHVDVHGFVEDPFIYEILPAWIQHMPIVKSCQRCPADQPEDYVWGLSVPQQAADQIQLPVNSSVQLCPRRQFFEYHSIFALGKSKENPLQKALAQMRLLGLKPVDSIYRNILMYTEYQSDGTVEHSILYIPFIQESFIPDPDRD